MNITSILEFNKRYYEWSLKDAEREVRDDFPFVRLITSDIAGGYLALMLSRPLEERVSLARLFVKRDNLFILNRGFSADEQAELARLVKEFTADNREPVTAERLAILKLIIGGDSLDDEAMESMLSRKRPAKSSEKRLSTTKLRTITSDYMSHKFECKPERGPDGEIVFTTVVNKFTIKTSFLVARRMGELSYVHSIDELPVQQISILSWLGVSRQTRWVKITERNVSTTLDDIFKICTHFLAAAKETVKRRYMYHPEVL